eukprot:jgi/Psemu1/211191/e_gw1.558.31.1
MSATDSTPIPVRPIILPSRGVARVKSVLSGDTVILLGKASGPNGKAPEVIFTLENISAPRLASKGNSNTDEPGAFLGREWLRALVVGKMVAFETRKQGASAGDRVYGLLNFTPPGAEPDQTISVALEAVRNGFATPRMTPSETDEEVPAGGPEEEWKMSLWQAYDEAKRAQVGIHSMTPLVRQIKNAGDAFESQTLVDLSKQVGPGGKIKCVIEYVFDGSRFRLQVTDPSMGELQYGSFTLLLAGVTSPRVGNPRSDPPSESEEFAEQARTFAELRVLQRELDIVLHGTDKSGVCAVGSILHPKGNIAAELLKNGLAHMSDWSLRMMPPANVPELRSAEKIAKTANLRIWQSYVAPELTGAAEISGTVVEVLTGDTVNVLPDGEVYDSEDKLVKISLASIRAPRVGNERVGRASDPYSAECKDRLRVMTVGKHCKVQVHYEREIPFGGSTELRQFGTLSTKNKADIGEALISEGLATTQYHRDGEETSPRYDDLRTAEAVAKASKRGMHSDKAYKSSTVNDLSTPQKAKSYSGSLMRAGKLKGIVEYCFNGSRFKMLIPSENCYIMFAPNAIRVPQPSPPAGSVRQVRPAEPFGDASKRHARLTLLQRTVEVNCMDVTQGGVIVGSIFTGQGVNRKDYSLELLNAGLATVDQRKIDYGEAPKELVDAQTAAQAKKIGIWSIAQPTVESKAPKPDEKAQNEVLTVRISEIRSGTHFFCHVTSSDAAKRIEEGMKLFTANNGTEGAPCEVKVNRLVAALFDDGSGKSWYRAKIVEKQAGGTKAVVLFLDHGNIATVPVATHLRPLDPSLGTDQIPAAAKEATLALTISRPLSDDHGLDCAHKFQKLCWGKDLRVCTTGRDESGKMAIVIFSDSGESVNEQLVRAGLARVAKPSSVQALAANMVDGSTVIKLAADLNAAQEVARKSRAGMWQYGDIGDEDEDEGF